MNGTATRHFDVFNGDADGLCALQQLRLAEPKVSTLITGIKRDIALLERVDTGAGDSITVLDVALGPNLAALLRLLGGGARVEYFDHHHAAALPTHPLLRLNIDDAPGVCTSVLVSRHLHGRFRAWAVVGAFGDNLPQTATGLAASIGINARNLQLLKALGECLNYNAYGETEADLAIAPQNLYRLMQPYADPLDFIKKEEICVTLAELMAEDMNFAMNVDPLLDTERLLVVLLPDAAWARRVVGSYANRRRIRRPEQVCVIAVPNSPMGLNVSLRTPDDFYPRADELARRHGGDGRATAAGITDLPHAHLGAVLSDFQQVLEIASQQI